MLLRIIDKGEKNGITVEFTSDKKCEYYKIEKYKSPHSQNFLALLNWYFTDYIAGSADIKDDRRAMEKLVMQSRYLGDAIIGEDHELIRFKDYIEHAGYENLEVRIESDRHEFFCELWETIILPDSKYFLSTVVGEFSRTFSRKDRHLLPAIEFGLNVTSPISKQMSQMLDNGIPESEQENAPLKILYIVSRNLYSEHTKYSMDDIQYGESCALNLALNHANTEGAIDIEVWPLEDWNNVIARLKSKDKPIHIVHFDGCILVDSDQAFFITQSQDSENAQLAVADFVRILLENKIALLNLDIRAYITKGKVVSHSYGLAVVARIADHIGLGNIIGLSHKTSAWQSNDCFKSLYQQIAAGHALNRAVVEARKSLQSRSNTETSTIRKLPLQKWPLLVHYGNQSVTFFKEPQSFLPPEESHILNINKAKLFGFYSAMLPPQFRNVSDRNLLSVFSLLNLHRDSTSNKVITLLGGAGIGKTQLSHTLSFYLASKKIINYGFYFDFERDSFSISDIKEMISPILQTDPESLFETLKNRRCCFVFDGLNSSIPDDLKFLVDNLLAQSHIVIVCSRELNGQLLKPNTIIQPLTQQERHILAMQIVEKYKIDPRLEDDNWIREYYTLLENTLGNPFLIRSLIALLEPHSPSELNRFIENNVKANEKNSCVEQYYRWQWSQTHEFWKIFLLLASQTHNLLIEVIMIVWGKKGNADSGPDLQESINKIYSLDAHPDLEISFSDMIKRWNKQGFIKETTNGHVLDYYFLSKIRPSISEEHNISKALRSDDVKLTFSQLICEGLTRLSSHLIQQQDQTLLQYLLNNRRAWVDHFERLWRAEDFKRFFNVKNIFDQILLQAKIGDESATWSLDLSNRTYFDIADKKSSASAKLAWLTLATSGMKLQTLDADKLENHYSDVCKKAEKIQAWLDANSLDDLENATLFYKTCFFLDAFYLKAENWNQLIILGNKVYPLFLEREIWVSAIKMLKSMSVSHLKLCQVDEACICEEKLIHEIPYEKSPQGYRSQVLLEVVLSRIARKDYNLAQQALDILKSNDDAKNIDDLIQTLQSEIFYETEEYRLALPYFSKLWTQASNNGHQQQMAQIKDRLIVIKNKIGEEDFSQIISLETLHGVINPQIVGNSLALH